jgi:hypothetical protein
MRTNTPTPLMTVCVLTYGEHFELAHQCIESIRANTARPLYRLVVGANAVGTATDDYLGGLQRAGHIDQLHCSRRNLNKCPMMRRMFEDVNTPYIFWFDDDSYLIEAGALDRQLQAAQRSSAETMMWGSRAGCNDPATFIDIPDVEKLVRTAPWYGGLTPPGRLPGGKGEFNYEGRGTGNPWWQFIVGGFWLIRTEAIRALDWPDRRLTKLGDDVLLGEALRQQGWTIENTGAPGVAINRAPRRGELGGLGTVTGRGGLTLSSVEISR